MMIQIRNIVSRCFIKNVQTKNLMRSVQTSCNVRSNANQENVQVKKLNENEQEDADSISEKLMSFFDIPNNWGKTNIISGRAWKIDELRIKSNADLHNLWFVLYKERNMLLTMENEAKRQVENMPSPERIDKVEESMKNIEEVVKERNKAYYMLEVGDDQYAERRRAFRRDRFGRWRWMASSEHLIPYWMNKKFRELNGPGFEPEVVAFNRQLAEKKAKKQTAQLFAQAWYCRQLLRRFPNIDLDYLQEKFPNVNVQHMKNNLNQYISKDRIYKFSEILYQKPRNI